jgi:hypothetical protein
MKQNLKFHSLRACKESNTTLIQKLATAIEILGERYSAMCRENSDHEGSTEGFAVVGEQDGVYRALVLTPATTSADWHVKNVAIKNRCACDGDDPHSAAELTDELNAELAASLLDDAAALLKGDDLAPAA